MGSSVAAAFIEHFIGDDVEYVHLDIAGTSSNPSNEATGTPVNALQKFALLQ
jgi:leucyl aminopeptidase